MEELSSDLPFSLADKSSEREIRNLYPLVADILARWDKAKRARMLPEQRWLKCYVNFRGLAEQTVKFTATERSQIFVKLTKTKCLAAYGQIIEVLFATGKVPLTIDPTPVPEGILGEAHIDLDDPAEKEDAAAPQDPGLGLGYPGDGNDLKPGETLMDRIGAYLAAKFKGAKVKDDFSDSPKAVNLEPAKIAAKKMERKIHDQLDESSAAVHLKHTIYEMIVMGTGVLKGPFTVDKEYPKWDALTGDYTPVVKAVPKISTVSCWNFYPDPEAIDMADADYCFERHRMTKSQVRALKKRPFFRSSEIDALVKDGPNYTREWFEHSLDDSGQGDSSERWEVLEYWGTVDADMLDDFDIAIPDSLAGQDEYQVNVWVSGDKLLRVVLNPFVPRNIPYMACPFELNPYNFWGTGVAENLEDSQTLLNGFWRLAIDNAVMSANVVFEVDETNLVPGQTLEMYPGKVIRRQGGAPGQAIFSHKWDNTTQENMLMVDRVRQAADESSGIPSSSHGQTGVLGSNPGRTASGTSMLMGAAQTTIKTVISNLDAMLQTLGERLFHWNMQFDFDPSIKGDLEVNARGTASLMQREVKSQRLIQFLQTTANPITGPLVKFDTILRDIAISLDLDPEKMVNNPQEAQVMAQLIAQTNAKNGGSMPGAPQAMDQTGGGGGTIAPGAAPTPGMDQFSGATPPNAGTAGQGAPAPAGPGGGM